MDQQAIVNTIIFGLLFVDILKANESRSSGIVHNCTNYYTSIDCLATCEVQSAESTVMTGNKIKYAAV